MEIKEIISGIQNFDKMHYTPDGYFAYGKVDGQDFYALKKDYPLAHYGYEQEQFYPNLATAKALLKKVNTYCVMWYSSLTDNTSICYVIAADINVDNIEMAICPEGYTFIGVTVQGGESSIDLYKYDQLASTYVPCNNGPNNSILPILWRVDQPHGGIATYDVFLKDTTFLFDREVFMDAITRLKNDLPAVDLDTEPEKRFITLEVDDGVYFMYNRNHVAYNGNTPYYEEFAPIVFWAMATYWDCIEFENFTEYITSAMTEDEIKIIRKGSKEWEEPVMEDITNIMPAPVESTPVEPAPEKEFKHEDNILLRAAKASDIDYK